MIANQTYVVRSALSLRYLFLQTKTFSIQRVSILEQTAVVAPRFERTDKRFIVRHKAVSAV